jgi:hypothetical protein
MNNININDLSVEDIQQLLVLKQKLESAENKFDRHATYNLPGEILEDLEESSKKELQSNVQKFNRECLKYEGGQWTRSGAINKVFISDLKKYNVDSFQFINHKYKHAERLRTAARVSTEIFQAL